MKDKFKTYKIDADNISLEIYLKEKLKISARNRQKLFYSGAVLVNGKKTFSKRNLKKGDIVSIRIREEDNFYGVEPQTGNVEVLYEDENCIVLNKPAGILVHPAGKTTAGTLANYLANYFREKGKVLIIRPVHRLDRDTSGCVLFAKSAELQREFSNQLEKKEIQREYIAIVEGRMIKAEGRIDKPIGKSPLLPNRRQVSSKGKNAVTLYKVKKELHIGYKEATLLEIRLETGRTHQIRVHMSYVGSPVLGDKMYGVGSSIINRQALHASKISFRLLDSYKNIIVEAPLPDDMKRLIYN